MTDISANTTIVAVTGGIACGKSTAGAILKKMGFEICDADSIAHQLMEKGTPVYDRIVKFFGSGVLSEDGDISRPDLGKVVFANDDARQELNNIVHPAVKSFLETWIKKQREAGINAAAEIPLLFESGIDNLNWDSIVCISSSERLVFSRLAERGIDRNQAFERINAQMPLVKKEDLSDYVVQNNGTLKELEDTLQKAIRR